MADYSKGIDWTGVHGYNQTLNGQISLNFECTIAQDGAHLYGKNVAISNDITRQVFYLTSAWLSCVSTPIRLMDGSFGDLTKGQYIVALQCSSLAPMSQSWDFKLNPLICLTADGTQSLCISYAGTNATGGIQGYWGAKPQ